MVIEEVCQRTGQRSDAGDDFDSAILVEPKSAPGHFWRGYLLATAEDATRKNLEDAVADFDKAIEFSSTPDKPSFSLFALRTTRARCYIELGKPDQAGEDLTEVIRISHPEEAPSILPWIEALIAAYDDAGRVSDAILRSSGLKKLGVVRNFLAAI